MFRFKRFHIDDSRCGMKVGTDGVLLGAWAASLPPHSSILDIGTGSGLIALMLAQRFPNAQILGIDIDSAAVSQAQENFAASPWSNRLQAQCISLQDFSHPSGGVGGGFCLIVSNPPFFQNSLKNPNEARALARHTDTLSYEDLLSHAAALLCPQGLFCVVLPIEAEQTVLEEAKEYNLQPIRSCKVRGNERKPYKRILLEFCKTTEEQTCFHETLTLEDTPNHRSEAYQTLTQDFYL